LPFGSVPQAHLNVSQRDIAGPVEVGEINEAALPPPVEPVTVPVRPKVKPFRPESVVSTSTGMSDVDPFYLSERLSIRESINSDRRRPSRGVDSAVEKQDKKVTRWVIE